MAEKVIRNDTVRPSDRSASTANVYKDAGGTKLAGTVKKDMVVQVYEDLGSMIRIKFSYSSGYMSKADVIKGDPLFGDDGGGGRYTYNQLDSNSALTGTNSTEYVRENTPQSEQERYKDLNWKIAWAFGAPPKFNMDVDIQYADSMLPGYGRVTTKTIMSNPSIISICPGAVDFLPDFNNEERDGFLKFMQQNANGPTSSKISRDAAYSTGKLYTFKSAYTEYCKILNTLCRACAIMLGIGDEYIPNTSIKLKAFDYGYWQMRTKVRDQGGDGSIFKDFWDGLTTVGTSATSDAMYMHYFITNAETSVSESASTSPEKSKIDEIINNSDLSDMAKNINFLFGGPTGSGEAEEAFQFLQDSNLFAGEGFLSKIGKAAINYIQGGRMVIPLMLGDVSYEKSISCSATFMSPYGDKKAVFFNCLVPVCSLMAFSLPKQLSENMYTYPFIIRAYEQGWWSTDLAVIQNIRINRGGQDDTSWTQEGLATEWTVQFDIQPLHSELMVTSSDHPFLFMQNDGLLEFLGNMCGIDLKANNIGIKMELALDMLLSRIRDIPTSLGRGIGENFVNAISHIFQFQNG